MGDEKKELLDALADMERRGEELTQKKQDTERRIKRLTPPPVKNKSRTEILDEKLKKQREVSKFAWTNYGALALCIIAVKVLVYRGLTRDERMSMIFGIILAFAVIIRILVQKGKL